MSRVYNRGGAERTWRNPGDEKAEGGAIPVFMHPEMGPAIKVPVAFTGGKPSYVPHKPGNVYLAALGSQFCAIEKGKLFELPPGLSLETAKALAPQLISEEEARAEGLIPPLEPLPPQPVDKQPASTAQGKGK